MKRLIKFWGASLLVGMLLVAAIAVACLLWAEPFAHTVINIDGEPFSLAQWHGRHGLAGFAGLMLGAAVLLLVVPVAVMVPLLIVAIVLVTVLAVLAGVAALVFSPVVLLAGVVWLIWRLARRGAKPATPLAP